MPQITAALTDFALGLSFERLPGVVVSKTKEILLDCIGCALGAYATDRARLALELVADFGGHPQATIIGSGPTSSPLAAFANGELINALDYEPTGPLAPHVCTYVFPPALAVGERVKASGREMLTALALALETGGRVLGALSQQRVLQSEPPAYAEAERYSFSPAIFGGVAGAGRLLGLDRGQLAHAFGIGGASTPVPAGMKALRTPGNHMIKYNCWAGWVSQLGTVAALAAQRGYTGDTTILDGEWGFWKIYGSPFFDTASLLGGLGETWHIEAVNFKAYPCCGLNQSSVEAVRSIVRENGLRPEDIDEILISGDPMLPTRTKPGIDCFEDTQFCNEYIAAVAACQGGQPSLAWQTGSVADDPRVKALMPKVRVEMHPEAPERITAAMRAGGAGALRGSVVTITAGGRRFTAAVAAPRGAAANPMSYGELTAKFRDNASYSALKSSAAEQVIEAVNRLEDLEDIGSLMALLTVPKSRF